jgi:hypothetical protein
VVNCRVSGFVERFPQDSRIRPLGLSAPLNSSFREWPEIIHDRIVLGFARRFLLLCRPGVCVCVCVCV